jgi:peptide/nickel transport system substrate-binding protein
MAAALRPRPGRAQDGGVLRVRSYSDLQVLDPAHRKAQPEGDIMRCIYTKLIDYAPGDAWQWRPTGAARIEQGARPGSGSRCAPASCSRTASAR